MHILSAHSFLTSSSKPHYRICSNILISEPTELSNFSSTQASLGDVEGSVPAHSRANIAMKQVTQNIRFLSACKFSSVQSLSCVWLFATPWTAACQASLSITNSQSLLKLLSIESVMPSNHLILCYPLLFPPSIFPSFRVFSNESVLNIRWPKYWSFRFSISHFNEYSGLIPHLWHKEKKN